jgi:hypothetical protein
MGYRQAIQLPDMNGCIHRRRSLVAETIISNILFWSVGSHITSNTELSI